MSDEAGREENIPIQNACTGVRFVVRVPGQGFTVQDAAKLMNTLFRVTGIRMHGDAISIELTPTAETIAIKPVYRMPSESRN